MSKNLLRNLASVNAVTAAQLARWKTYAPQVRFDGKEAYFPSGVELFLQHSKLVLLESRMVPGSILPVYTEYQADFYLRGKRVNEVRTPSFDDLGAAGYTANGRESGTGTATSRFKLRELDASARGGAPRTGNQVTAPCYVAEVAGPGFVDIQYWFFYPYNGDAWFNLLGAHVGDWEGVIVRVDPARVAADPIGAILGVRYGWHSFDQWTFPRPAPGQIACTLADTHPIVYAGRYSHASYWSTTPPRSPDTLYRDDADGKGPVWNIAGCELRAIAYDPASGAISPDQTWLRFTGRWGDTDNLIAGSPTGPAMKGVWNQIAPEGPGMPDGDRIHGKLVVAYATGALPHGEIDYQVFDRGWSGGKPQPDSVVPHDTDLRSWVALGATEDGDVIQAVARPSQTVALRHFDVAAQSWGSELAVTLPEMITIGNNLLVRSGEILIPYISMINDGPPGGLDHYVFQARVARFDGGQLTRVDVVGDNVPELAVYGRGLALAVHDGQVYCTYGAVPQPNNDTSVVRVSVLDDERATWSEVGRFVCDFPAATMVSYGGALRLVLFGAKTGITMRTLSAGLWSDPVKLGAASQDAQIAATTDGRSLLLFVGTRAGTAWMSFDGSTWLAPTPLPGAYATCNIAAVALER